MRNKVAKAIRRAVKQDNPEAQSKLLGRKKDTVLGVRYVVDIPYHNHLQRMVRTVKQGYMRLTGAQRTAYNAS